MSATPVDLRDRALTLLREAGVPLNLRRNKVWFDGKAIAAGKRISVEDMLHEGAHWLVAPEERRTVVNYGLGPDPNADTPKTIASPYDEHYDGLAEEVLTDGAGILMCAVTGADWHKVMVEHQWSTTDEDGIDDLRRSAKALRMVGIHVPLAVQRKVEIALKKLISQ